jgi:hypothetical protein
MQIGYLEQVLDRHIYKQRYTCYTNVNLYDLYVYIYIGTRVYDARTNVICPSPEIENSNLVKRTDDCDEHIFYKISHLHVKPCHYNNIICPYSYIIHFFGANGKCPSFVFKQGNVRFEKNFR